MHKNENIYISHILQSIEHIQTYTKGMNEDDFLRNRLIQDAVIRQFEIIGEATKHISAEFRNQHPDVPWKRMAGLRYKLIHDYIDVDIWAVWAIVETQIEDLKQQLENILKK